MADLSAVTAADVRAVEVIEQYTLPIADGVTVAAGVLVGIDTNGEVVLADADTGPVYTKGIAISVDGAGKVCTFVRKGLIDCGDVFTALNPTASVYSSGTAGRMADAAVGGLAAIGTVEPAWGYTTVDKLLRVDL